MLRVALLGFGVVGSGVAEVITENQDQLCRMGKGGVRIVRILDLREFPDSPFGPLVVHDFSAIVNDPEVDVVVEMMGGSHPAYEYTRAALEAGKHVVTSNKEVVANFGTELLAVAAAHGVRYLFEASVGGGIPLLRPLAQDMAGNRVTGICGILNGTTNYILTRMKEAGISFAAALAEAQEKGYAERDPSADVDGKDTARKTVILAAVAGGGRVDPDRIPTKGIRDVSREDVAAAEALQCRIKLIGQVHWNADGEPVAWVAPCFVPLRHPLAGVDDVFNGVLIHTDMLGDTMFYGRGAGKLPTAGAVVSDLLDLILHPYDSQTAPHWIDVTPAADDGAFPVACLFFRRPVPATLPEGAKSYSLPENGGTVVILPGTSSEAAAHLTAAADQSYPVLRI